MKGPGVPSPPSPSLRVEILTAYSVFGFSSSMVKLHSLPQLKWVTIPTFSSRPRPSVWSQILYHMIGGSPTSPLTLLHGSHVIATSRTPGPSFAMFGGKDNTGNSTRRFIFIYPTFRIRCVFSERKFYFCFNIETQNTKPTRLYDITISAASKPIGYSRMQRAEQNVE